MDEADFTGVRVAILGLGLMGGSLAMALHGKCATLLGIDPHPETLALAREWGVVDEAAAQPGESLACADLVLLATPVRTIIGLLEKLPALHPGSPVVIDLGSTKAQIVEAMGRLPARFDPLGGHPMCGKERVSLANAEAGLYQGAPFALTPLARTSLRARALAEQLVRAVGAQPLWLDPVIHDRWVGATSHLPYLVANALAAVTPPEARPLVGPGLRSTVRLAPSPWVMMGDILATNRENVLAGLRGMRERLGEIETLLERGDYDGLQHSLAEGARNYAALMDG